MRRQLAHWNLGQACNFTTKSGKWHMLPGGFALVLSHLEPLVVPLQTRREGSVVFGSRNLRVTPPVQLLRRLGDDVEAAVRCNSLSVASDVAVVASRLLEEPILPSGLSLPSRLKLRKGTGSQRLIGVGWVAAGRGRVALGLRGADRGDLFDSRHECWDE
jgi:hypothetical protein